MYIYIYMRIYIYINIYISIQTYIYIYIYIVYTYIYEYLVHSCVERHDSFICVPSLFHSCSMTHAFVGHDSFILVL